MASCSVPVPDDLSPKAPPFWHRIFPVNVDLAIKSIVGVWAAYLVINGLRATMWGVPDHGHPLIDYIVMTVISVTVTWLLYRLLVQVGQRTAFAVFILTVPTIFLAFAAVYLTNMILAYPQPMLDNIGTVHHIPRGQALSHFFDTAFVHYLILLGWGGIYLAMANSRSRQIALVHSRNLERLTRGSEMRALRYQLNPHFLFNALNSVSCLIIDKQNGPAESLVDAIADYMRSVLDDDDDMITVGQEISQQIRYLEIEQVRFPSRLTFEVHIDNEVCDWKIPALILQPLIENAVKHGVARSSGPVRIVISAEKDAGRLKLVVTNDGRVLMTGSKGKGTGTGLANIRERLAALYGPAAALLTGNGSNETVVATVIIPDEQHLFRDY